MAFRRKNVRKSFRKKFRARGKKSDSAGAKALRIVKSLQKKVEYKYYDYNIEADELYSTGQCYPLLEALAKGDNSNQRTGDIISLARAHIYLSCFLPSGGSGDVNTQSFRVMIVRGIRENGLVPVMSYVADANRGILDDTTSPLTLSRKAVDNMRNTKIIYDKIFSLTVGQKTRLEFRWNFKLKWNARYQKGTSGLLEDGGLYLLLAQTTSGSGNILCNMNHRITFSDD